MFWFIIVISANLNCHDSNHFKQEQDRITGRLLYFNIVLGIDWGTQLEIEHYAEL